MKNERCLCGKMIDLHSHILPEVDDGSRDMEMSLAMARMAVADGITEMAATPHVFSGFGPFQPADSAPMTAALQARLDAEAIPLLLHPCCEMPLLENYQQLLRDGRWLSYDAGGKYVLLEMPPIPHGYPILLRAVKTVGMAGKVPLLAHPERLEMLADPARVQELLAAGALLQVTSFCYGDNVPGSSMRNRALLWLERGWVSVVATDAHRPDRRPPLMSAAARFVARTMGPAVADALFTANPRAILGGLPLPAQPLR